MEIAHINPRQKVGLPKDLCSLCILRKHKWSPCKLSTTHGGLAVALKPKNPQGELSCKKQHKLEASSFVEEKNNVRQYTYAW